MTPQWPSVVTSDIFQAPSYDAALAGAAERMIARAAAEAAARVQVPIMEVLIVALLARHCELS